MKFNRLSAILLAAAMILTITSCKKTESEETTDDTASESTEYSDPNLALTNTYSDINLADYITGSGYKGLEVTAFDATVSDEEFEQYIQELLTENSSLVSVTDRSVQTGDTVDINYAGTMDNMETPSGLTGSKSSLVIGSDSFIPGFEDGIIGMNVGETKDIHVTFPDSYSVNTDLEGQDATFVVTLNGIKTTQIPEFNDYFVATISDYDNVEDYRNAKMLELYAENYATGIAAQRQELWEQLCEIYTCSEYPQEEYQGYYDAFVDYYTEYGEYYGYTSLEEFITDAYGTTMENFEATAKEYAEELCFEEMLPIYIGQLENVTFTEEDYQAAAAEYVDNYGFDDVETMESYYGRDTIARSIYIDKVLDKVLEYAVVVEATEETETDTDTAE